MNDDGFLFLADQPALDLLNTVRTVDGVRKDLLASPGAVAEWLGVAGLPSAPGHARPAAPSLPQARVLLTETVALREAIRQAVDCFARGTVLPESSVHALNRALEARRTGTRLDIDGVQAVLREARHVDLPLGLLAPVAEAAAHLLASGDRRRVRQCDAGDCRLWFYDTSRNGRRRWCSMARCGNRAKVAAHYRRTRALESPPLP